MMQKTDRRCAATFYLRPTRPFLASMTQRKGRYPIEISPPDIIGHRAGNTGVDYTSVLDSGQPGPCVMVQALTHGNEYCGAIALNWLIGQRVALTKGKLVLSYANVEAFARFEPSNPDRSRYVDEDMNRVWSDDVLMGDRDTVETRRARQLVPFVDAADYLLDIHSMHEACSPIMVCGTSEKSVVFARKLGVPGDLLIDTGHPSGLRMIERGGFGDSTSPRVAVLIECGQHWERRAADVAIDTIVRFLEVTGIVQTGWAHKNRRVVPPERQRLVRNALPRTTSARSLAPTQVRVTVPVVARSMQFRFTGDYRGLEVCSVLTGTMLPLCACVVVYS